MKTAIAYVRASKDEQKLSPDAQRSLIQSWAARLGVRVLGWYTEHVTSDVAPEDRVALPEALAAVKRFKATFLVVAKRDRLARSVLHAALIDRQVESYGARVISADGLAPGDQPEDQFVRTLLDANAALEKAQIKKRTKAALQVKKDRGECIGTVPWGFRRGRDGIKLVRDENEQATFMRIRELKQDGYSLSQISLFCTREGRLSRTGRPLSPQQIHRLLRGKR